MANFTRTSADERIKTNTALSNAIKSALMEIHGQSIGVRITSITTDVEPLNPPGYGYSIKVSAQVSLSGPNEKAPKT